MEKLLEVQALDHDLFMGTNLFHAKGARGSYGGHIIAHVMKAALMTLEEDRHDFLFTSLHCYFISPVKPEKVIYQVDSRKNSRTFSFRSIRAIQNGKMVFHCLISFRSPDSTDGDLPYNNHPMPLVPSPGDPLTITYKELVETMFGSKSSLTGPFEVYMCLPHNWEAWLKTKPPTEPKLYFWMRLKEPLRQNDPNHHRIALGYVSDWNLAGLIRHKYPNIEVELITSLDHNLWFHRDINLYKWHLLEFECQSSNCGQSLNMCRIFSEDGDLVASAMQQSLIRAKL